MRVSAVHHRSFGNTHLRVPPIGFATCALADRRRVIPDQTKLELCADWFRHVSPPVLIEDTAHLDHQRALEILARAMQRLDIPGAEIVLSLKMPCGLSAGDYSAILDQAPTGGHVVAALELPENASAQSRCDEPGERFIASYHKLEQLKAPNRLIAIGASASDWRALEQLDAQVPLDWVALDGAYTLMRHPPDLLAFMDRLAARGVPIIVSRVFESGYLVGGSMYDNRVLQNDNPDDRQLLAWRKSFVALCHGHGFSPAHACIQFALAGPGVVAVVVDTTYPDRIAENVSAATTKVPEALWHSMKEEGLLAHDDPFVT